MCALICAVVQIKKYGLLTKCEVKMAGYWPSSFFFACRDEVEVHKLAKKTRPISSHLDRTNLVNKGFIIWVLRTFCLRYTAGGPERARWLHLAHSGPRCIPQEKLHRKPYNKSFTDQVCSVKRAGYWPRSFFASL